MGRATWRIGLTVTRMNIQVTIRTFKEGRNFVAHAIGLDVSSCGRTKEAALKNLKEAVTLFLEEAEEMGTLSQILVECGYSRSGSSSILLSGHGFPVCYLGQLRNFLGDSTAG